MDRHQADQALFAGRPHDLAQWEMDVAGRQRDERALHGVDAAGGIEELLDVRFAQHEDLSQACNLGKRVWRTTDCVAGITLEAALRRPHSPRTS